MPSRSNLDTREAWDYRLSRPLVPEMPLPG